MSQEKEYTGTFTLGASTPTYDLESEPQNLKEVGDISIDMLKEITKHFTGVISQVPPIHSAIKQAGKPVYVLARKGIDVKLEPRKITVYQFEITKVALPIVSFRVVCTTGTYIRSLANDFGAALGCGAYLSSLCRTRIGEFTLDQAIQIEEFERQMKEVKI
jgi:tRNA pseudouridine55 synthase